MTPEVKIGDVVEFRRGNELKTSTTLVYFTNDTDDKINFYDILIYPLPPGYAHTADGYWGLNYEGNWKILSINGKYI